MFQYIKTIENLENISPMHLFRDVLGVISDINVDTCSFIFYAEDTEISFKCRYTDDKIISGLHENDSVILGGLYFNDYVDEAHIIVSKLEKAPFKLTGSMLQDSLMLAEESYNIIHVMGGNGYISDEDWGKLQELYLNYRDLIKNIRTEKDLGVYKNE